MEKDTASQNDAQNDTLVLFFFCVHQNGHFVSRRGGCASQCVCVLFKSHISADKVAASVHVDSYLCFCPIVSHRAPGCCIFNQLSSLNDILCVCVGGGGLYSDTADS